MRASQDDQVSQQMPSTSGSSDRRAVKRKLTPEFSPQTEEVDSSSPQKIVDNVEWSEIDCSEKLKKGQTRSFWRQNSTEPP